MVLTIIFWFKKSSSECVNRRRTDKTNGQGDKQRSTKNYTENKIEQHEPHQKPEVIPGALEGCAVSAPLGAPVVSL